MKPNSIYTVRREQDRTVYEAHRKANHIGMSVGQMCQEDGGHVQYLENEEKAALALLETPSSPFEEPCVSKEPLVSTPKAELQSCRQCDLFETQGINEKFSSKTQMQRPMLEPPTSSPFDHYEAPVVAIIMEALLEQLRANSQFWTATFGQATEEIKQMSTLIAPTCNATKAAYQAQGDATEKDADVDQALGFASCTAGALSLGMTFGQSTKAWTKEELKLSKMAGTDNVKNGIAKSVAAESAAKASSASNAAASSTAASQASSASAAAANAEPVATAAKGATSELSLAEKAKRASSWVNVKKWYNRLGIVCSKWWAASAGANATSQGIAQVTRTASLKSQKAALERQQGQEQARQKENEMNSQIHQMQYEREEGFRQNTQQTFDSVYQTLMGIIDGFGQVVARLFQ